MPQVIIFPREYERQVLRDIDKEFFLIWIVTFLVLAGFFFSMSQKELKILSAEEIKRYQEVIYRVQATPPTPAKTVTEVVSDGGGVAEEVAAEVVEEEVAIEEKPQEPAVTEVSQQAKKEVREEKRAARQGRQEARREKVRAAADRMKILAGPTAAGGRRTQGGAAAAEALGLTSGNVQGYDVKNMVGIVGDSEKRDKVKKARGQGAISDDAGDIDISELKEISLEDGEMMFQETKIDMNRSTITARGRASTTRQRSQSAISEVVMQNKNQVQYCYWTLKRRDSSLRGRVVIEFTINPAGEIIKVRFRKSEWGGNRLGADVERCINNVISGWHFEAIDPSAGNVTAGATYVFE